MSNSISVKSKINGRYTIKFIENLNKSIKQIIEDPNAIFIIDQNVKDLFKTEINDILVKGRYILITSNEKNKTLEYSCEVIDRLISKGVKKDSVLVALGGGITQDIVAFISSILFRGVEWVFYPTTLLAQCDSCIGSKSSINFNSYKNLLGTFSPPKAIYIHFGFLETLNESEIRSGIGEMLHYFLTEKSNLANLVEINFKEMLTNRKLLSFYIKNSLRIKKRIIEIDEFDTNIRHIFNYGHTFGHAIEAITQYRIPHGQAVTIGIDLANYISMNKGFISIEEFDKMHKFLVKNITAFRITDSNIDLFIKALSKDKKNKNNLLGCILPKGVGIVEKVFVEMDTDFKDLILKYFKIYGG